MTDITAQKAYIAALEWYLDQGIDDVLGCESCDHTKTYEKIVFHPRGIGEHSSNYGDKTPPPVSSAVSAGFEPSPLSQSSPVLQEGSVFLGTSEARLQAAKLAASAKTLDELQEAIAQFSGLSIKKTATNMVFSDGNPDSRVMLIGEAPGAEEDLKGKPFVGASGRLLDKILASIGLDRRSDDPKRCIYISNILNWRPPGNRTPSPAEIDISLPFIERHIQLVRPKVLILCGGVSAKALLASNLSISRLRKTWHEYKVITEQLQGMNVEEGGCDSIAAIATYHPSYLLRTPLQKKHVWADMLEIDKKISEL